MPPISALEKERRKLENIFIQNPECFDCSTRCPKWASINHGVLICIRCAGIHRSLGVHISKVRSLTMDVLETSTIEMLESIGNRRGQSIFESQLPSGFVRPSISTSHEELEKIIRAKWEHKEYANRNWRELLFQHTRERSIAASPPSFTKVSNTIQGPQIDLLEFPAGSPKKPFAQVGQEFFTAKTPTLEIDAIVSAFDSPLV